MKTKLLWPMCFTSVLLVACNSNGGSSSNSDTNSNTSSSTTTNTSSSTTISGTITAPSGNIAFFKPHGIKRMLAMLLPESAYGGLSGLSAVAAGTPVKLIEVDSSGTQVGADIATGTTTTGGSYSLTVSSTFTPDPKYIVRATGSVNIDARVTSNTVDVDPVTDTASSLITSNGNLSSLSNSDADFITDSVESLAHNIDSSNNTISLLKTALTTAVQDNTDASNIIASMSATGKICGTVTDSSNNGLQNIRILVRDFGDWVTRAKTLTKADGTYCVHVPVKGDSIPTGGTFSGDYIVGAINGTSSSYAASQWWTSTGGANNQYSAGKISVPDTTTVTKNFTLSDGGRISGTIYATDGTTPLENIHIAFRDFKNDEPVALTRTHPDGTFNVNLAPGTYSVNVRNFSLQAYAGGVYSGPTSGSTTATSPGESRADATAITVTAAATTSTPMKLAAGAKVYGQVTDGTNALPGTKVRFYDAGSTKIVGSFVDGRPVNKKGKYRIWLQPGTYIAHARGQNQTITVSSTTPTNVDFTSASIHKITATLQDSSSNPVSQAKVFVHNAASPSGWDDFQISNGDGTVTLYSGVSSSLIEIKLDGGETTLGSTIYNGKTQLTAGTAVDTSADSDLGTLTIPAGSELKGTVTDSSSNPVANAIVQVRSGGTTAGYRFVTVRTSVDGSYTVSLPAATYTQVCAIDAGKASNTCNGTTTPAAGAGYAFESNVIMTASLPKTLNFQLP